MNWFDIVLLAVVVVSCFSGLRAGVARTVTQLLAIAVGLMTAFWCYGVVAQELEGLIHSSLAARIAGFCAIFFGVVIVGSMLGAMLARLFEVIGLGWLDHLLGGAVGLLRGALLAVIAVAVVMAFVPGPTPAFLAESRVLPYASGASATVADLAPRQIREGFVQQLDKLKQIWVRSTSKEQRVI